MEAMPVARPLGAFLIVAVSLLAARAAEGATPRHAMHRAGECGSVYVQAIGGANVCGSSGTLQTSTNRPPHSLPALLLLPLCYVQGRVMAAAWTLKSAAPGTLARTCSRW